MKDRFRAQLHLAVRSSAVKKLDPNPHNLATCMLQILEVLGDYVQNCTVHLLQSLGACRLQEGTCLMCCTDSTGPAMVEELFRGLFVGNYLLPALLIWPLGLVNSPCAWQTCAVVNY